MVKQVKIQQEQAVVGATERIKKRKKAIKKHRIIIRNLVFDINEKHLTKLLSPFGQIKEIRIPRDEHTNKAKGFAFIQFMTHRQCQKAIKQVNLRPFKGRKVVADFSVSKEVFTKDQQPVPKKEQPKQQTVPLKIQSQQIKKLKAQVRREMSRQPREQTAQDLSCQIFVRNVPLSTTQQSLFELFRQYGKIAFVKIVRDKMTQQSKGTAFVKFKEASTAQKLIEHSQAQNVKPMKGKPKIRVDPSISLQLEGTILSVFAVEPKDSIQDKIKDRESGDSNKTKMIKKPLKKINKLDDLIKYDAAGKRRLHLAKHGFWQATEEMNEEEYNNFKIHEKQKIIKLKNPNNVVSETRIILKFLPKTLSEMDIKHTCYRFLREQKKNRLHLTYCKLMLTPDRTKSIGFAFIEFKLHQTAFKFIEWVKINAEEFSNRFFLYQFSIQDCRKLMKRNKMLTKK